MPAIGLDQLECSIYLYPSVEHAVEGRHTGGPGFLAGLSSFDGEHWNLYAETNKHVVVSADRLGCVHVTGPGRGRRARLANS